MEYEYIPAFPKSVPGGNGGMALRDWFAGMAMSGFLSDLQHHDTPPTLAELSYKYADAMMEARRLKPNDD